MNIKQEVRIRYKIMMSKIKQNKKENNKWEIEIRNRKDDGNRNRVKIR